MVHWHISRICYRFEVIRHFILAGNCPFRPNLRVFWAKPPNFTTTHFSSPKGSSLYQTASFEQLCAKIGSRIWAVALLKEKRKKINYRTRKCCPTLRLDRSSDPNKFGRASNLPNVITHAKFQINWYKIVTLAKGWSSMFQHYYGGGH